MAAIENHAADLDRISFPANKIPVIVEPANESTFVLQQNKFLVASHYTVHEFLYHLRRRMQLPKTYGLFLLVNGRSLVNLDRSIKGVHQENKQSDGILYIHYITEATLG